MRRFIFFLLLSFASFQLSATDVYYVVKSNNLNVRMFPSTKSSVTGKLQKGDTIRTHNQDSTWIEFIRDEKKEYTGWVSAKHVEYAGVAPELTTSEKAIMFLNKYVTWKEELFWLFIVIGVVGSFYMLYLESEWEELYCIKKDIYVKDYSFLFYIPILAGIAMGLTYFFFDTETQNLLIRGQMKFIPIGQGAVAWVLWSLILIQVSTLLLNLFFKLKSFGISLYGIGIALYSTFYLSLSIVTFAFFVIGLIYLAIFAGIVTLAYWIITSKGDGPGYIVSSSEGSDNDGSASEAERKEMEKKAWKKARKDQAESKAYFEALDIEKQIRGF